MWIYLTLASAFFLGLYDITKKQSLRKNSVMWVLFSVSVLSTIILLPTFRSGSANDFLILIPKTILVTLSWISGLIGIKLLPLTTVSSIKASRPVFVILGSMLVFGERLSWGQWAGVVISLAAMWLMSRDGKKEGIHFTSNKGILWMGISIMSGVLSALYDKYAVKTLDPLFIQSWSNLFIAAEMGIVLLFRMLSLKKKGLEPEKFTWDWMLVLTAILIVGADMLYFFALKQEGAMLAIVSLTRRASVIVTFVLSAILFKEVNIKSKAVDLAIMLAGISLLVIFS